MKEEKLSNAYYRDLVVGVNQDKQGRYTLLEFHMQSMDGDSVIIDRVPAMREIRWYRDTVRPLNMGELFYF